MSKQGWQVFYYSIHIFYEIAFQNILNVKNLMPYYHDETRIENGRGLQAIYFHDKPEIS